MSRLSFFYSTKTVYKTTLRALQRRDFVISAADEETGVIIAVKKKGILKPNVSLELKIQQIADDQTSIDIKSSIKKNWLTPDGYESKAEQKFINTLYKCFDNA